MTDVDQIALEITPGVLKLVGECTDAELIAAGLTLMISDAPDDVWNAQIAVLVEVYEVRIFPTASERAARWPEPFMTAMAVLPEHVRQEAAWRWRLGLTAQQRAEWWS